MLPYLKKMKDNANTIYTDNVFPCKQSRWNA